MATRKNEILVVDDTLANLKLLLDMLVEHGYKVRPANNGEQALDSVAVRKPDLILLDIKMPGLNGYEVCQRLKEDEQTQDIPVIFISALDSLSDRIKGFEVGGVDYITKPFQHAEVLVRVDTHLQLHKMQEDLEQLVEERTFELRETNKELEQSEEKFRRIVEGLQEEYFFYTHGVDGTFTYLSPSVESVLGYLPEEFLVSFDKHFTDNPINAAGATATKQAIAGKKQPAYELELFHKDRSIRQLEIAETPVFDENKKVIAVEGIAHDITERKKAEEAVLRSEASLAEAQRIAHLGSWNWNILTNDLAWSDEVFRIFGSEPQDFFATYDIFLKLIHPDDRERVSAAIDKSVADPSVPYDIEHRIVREDDTERVVHERGEVKFDAQDRPVNMIGTVLDITERKNAEDAFRQAEQQRRDALIQAIKSFARIVERRDPYTAGHQERVSELAVAIARKMKLDEDGIEGIKLGGLIHDIGKINIPAEILNRPGKLSDNEFSIIKAHPQEGYEVMKDVPFPWPVADMIHQHHERIDGSGYPGELKGDEIILEARILAVADVVEAMSSHRPYRPAKGIDAAIEEIKKNRGKLYDSDIVDICVELFEKEKFKFKFET